MSTSLYDVGTGIIWLDDVICNGDESNITECSHRGWSHHNCYHNDDVGVMCVVNDTVGKILENSVCDDYFDRYFLSYCSTITKSIKIRNTQYTILFF